MATVFPLNKAAHRLRVTMAAGLVACLASMAATPHLAMADLGVVRTLYLAALSPLMAAGAIFFLGHTIHGLVPRRNRSTLRLTPDGIYVREWFGCRYHEWDKLLAVLPAKNFQLKLIGGFPRGVGGDRLQNWLTRLSLIRRTEPIYPAFFDVHPATVYYTLCFYRQHRELRLELGTEASVDRIQRNDFPGVAEEIRKEGFAKSVAGGYSVPE